MACLNVGISTKKLKTLKEVPGKHLWRYIVTRFINGYP